MVLSEVSDSSITHMSTSSGPVSPERDWRGWTPGTRVMVRTRLPEGSSHLYTDVLGTVVSRDEAGLVVRDRHGREVAVPAERIVAGKPVPPPPARRGRPPAG